MIMRGFEITREQYKAALYVILHLLTHTKIVTIIGKKICHAVVPYIFGSLCGCNAYLVLCVRIAHQLVHSHMRKQLSQDRNVLYGIICAPLHHRSIRPFPGVNKPLDNVKLCNAGINFLQQW